MTNHEIWQAVLADFELRVSKANFITWFKNTGISSFEGNAVTICVPNNFTKSWLEKKYNSDIVRCLERVTGKPVQKMIYHIENIKNIDERECLITTEVPTATPHRVAIMQQSAPRTTPNAQTARFASMGLNDKYTFDSFIVGKGNELAHAAAQAAANRPGEVYNPLFFYGGVGLGKTHLLHAIAHVMLSQNPDLRVLYVTSEKFTNEFVSAVKSGTTKQFKSRYRTIDLLLIDDIQFIGGKEQTQEEFFHTFNELHQQRKQVVLTSDRPPKAIPAIEDRLRSRFEWGMIADITSPDLETRVAILESKSQEKGFDLPSEVNNLIASTIQSNVRELEGALNKIIAYHQLKNIRANIESVRSLLDSYESKRVQKTITTQELIEIVSEHFNVSVEKIIEKSRAKHIAFPRQVIMYLLREELKMSYPAIGNELGGRDHTTAMHAHNKIRKHLESNEAFAEDLHVIKERLTTTPN